MASRCITDSNDFWMSSIGFVRGILSKTAQCYCKGHLVKNYSVLFSRGFRTHPQESGLNASLVEGWVKVVIVSRIELASAVPEDLHLLVVRDRDSCEVADAMV